MPGFTFYTKVIPLGMQFYLHQRIFALLLLGIGLTFASCSSGEEEKKETPAEEVIARSWKVKRFKMGNDPAPINIVATASFTFRKDGSYEILLGELEQGTWILSDDKKRLLTTPSGAQAASEIDIEVLTPERLVMSNNSGNPPVFMELIPQ